jgi:hypothetical protein
LDFTATLLTFTATMTGMNVVAYGSLMHRPSLEGTLRRPAALTPITVPGWRRVFNAPFPDGLSYLNIQPALSSQLAAAYFTVDVAELPLFAAREAGSELVEVVAGYHAFVWPPDKCRELPVLRSYLDVCRRGAAGLGVDLGLGTTWPAVVRDDAVSPLYR